MVMAFIFIRVFDHERVETDQNSLIHFFFFNIFGFDELELVMAANAILSRFLYILI